MLKIRWFLLTGLAMLLFFTVSCSASVRYSSRKDSVRAPQQSFTNGRSFTGEASYYGPKFHGRMTASGEAFNMYEFTAAHRTLPFGTILKVTNLVNGKSVTVKVNDRGPFKKNRVLDLSYSAAKKIGMLQSGTARIKAVIIKLGSKK